MTLIEAIKTERETAEHSIPKMSEYHEQIASWLDEYNKIKCAGIDETHGDCILACSVLEDTYQRSRNHAIDEVIKCLKAQFLMQNNPNSKFVETIVLHRDFIDALEQLKEQNK